MALVRKTVTVLFCDLVGSTSLGDQADPELLRDAMSRYHAELRTILERHGATVEKFVGDAAMAVFGLPQVHEDDGLRAVRAADEIRQRVAELGLEVRIGVNTGEVVAGEGETLVTGDAVNVAARLEQAAEAGEVLVGEGTERVVRGAVRAEPVEPLQLKGKADPVAAYRLLEVLADVPAFTRPIEAPFVGRGEELAALEAALATAVEQRQPQLATVVGPPGIGKSRLARELIDRSDARVLVGRCLSYGEGITYWPLQEIASQLGDLESVLEDELARARIAAALGEGSASSEEIAWGFRRLFEALARERSLIVVLDDIHWAEPTLLDLAEYVATFASDAALLVLCMARPDLFDQRPEWATPKPNATLLTLEPLPEEHTETLVEELGELPEEAKSRIVEAAEGNPLFVEQLVAHQAESRNGLEIPPTIQALLAARIDLLEAAERSVIERASVEGRLFHRGSVQALLPEAEREGVGGHLLTLVRKEFIRPDRSQLPGDDGFRFGHILIRDAAYDSLPKRERADLHERFADWIAQRMGDDAPAEIVGYHLERAYRYGAELGAPDETLAERAGLLLAEAGRRAHARSDAAAARALLERATELLPDRNPDVPSLLSMLGTAVFDAGDLPRALDTLRRAQSAAVAVGQRSVELGARMGELRILILGTPTQDTEQVLEEAQGAIAELAELGDVEALLRAWHAVGMARAMRAEMALMAEAEEQRLELARRAGLQRHSEDAAWELSAGLALGPMPVEEATRRLEQMLVELPEARMVETYLALLYAYAGRHDEAQEMMERSLLSLLELGQLTWHAGIAQNSGWIALLADEPGRVEQELRAAVDVLAQAGESGLRSTVTAVLAEVLYQLGQDEEAEEWTRRSEQASSSEDVLSQTLWRATRAKALARRGELEEALRLSAEAVDWGRRSDAMQDLGDALVARGEVLRRAGQADEARAAHEEALAVYERKGIVPSIERTRKALAELG